MPRAALLSIHARIEGTEPTAWEDPTLVQVWGPKFSAYVVAERDRAVFTLGRLPDEPRRRRVAEELADRLEALLGGRTMPYGEAGRGLGLDHTNQLRYAAPTGRVLIRWEGARQPTIWTVPAPPVDPAEAGSSSHAASCTSSVQPRPGRSRRGPASDHGAALPDSRRSPAR